MLTLTKAQSVFIENLPNLRNSHPVDFERLLEQNYSVKKTKLSYRQITNLSNDGIIVEGRNTNNKRGWRRFDLREAIYLTAVKKLKEYGLTNKQLVDFKESFYKKGELDKALLLVLGGEKIILTIDRNGKAGYLDWLYFFISHKEATTSYVSINLSGLVKEFFGVEKPPLLIVNLVHNEIQRIKRELGDYPKEMGMTEADIEKLIDQLSVLSNVLFEKWVNDKKLK